jgi:hypothetical protein
LYVFAVDGTDGGWLPTLIETMSTREGRQAMREAIGHRPNEGGSARVRSIGHGKAIAAETSQRKK